MDNGPHGHGAEVDRQLAENDVLAAIMEGCTDGICITDAEGRVTTFNIAAEILTGKNGGEVIGKTCAEVFGCEQGEECCLEKAATARGWTEAVCSIHRADGKPMTLRRRARAVTDSVGRFIGMAAVFSDYSLQENLQKKMVAYERLASMGELAASLVHEIGNPVSVILGFGRILVQQEGEDPDGDIRNRIFHEAQRCRDIVDNLLDYTRSAVRKSHPTPLVLKSIVDETLDLLSYNMRRQGVSWEVVWDVENTLVVADRGDLTQVFLNVFLNALQSMKKGGVIRIKGQTRSCMESVGGDSLLRPKRETVIKKRLVILLEDEGEGLGDIDPERCFAPFFSTKEKGGGLGLPVCRKLLAEYGGTIRLENRHGKGARAVIELPSVSKQSGPEGEKTP